MPVYFHKPSYLITEHVIIDYSYKNRKYCFYGMRLVLGRIIDSVTYNYKRPEMQVSHGILNRQCGKKCDRTAIILFYLATGSHVT